MLISWQVGFFGGGFLTTEVIVKKVIFPLPTDQPRYSSLVKKRISLLMVKKSYGRLKVLLISWQVEFFGGGFLTTEVIVKKMNIVLGILEPQGSMEVAPSTRNPPSIWCCLKSFYMDKNDP